MKILQRIPHRVTIQFDVDMAPELIDKLHDRLQQAINGMLGYPTYALDIDYSFNNPDLPEYVTVTIERK